MKKRRNVAAVKRRLPRTLRRFFWDYDFARLSWKSDRDLIIARILAGSLPAARLQVLPGLGHLAPVTHAARVNEFIAAHIDH